MSKPQNANLPIDRLATMLRANFPDAPISVRKSARPSGPHFLNLQVEDVEVAVQWESARGFGIVSFDAQDEPLDGYLESSTDWYVVDSAAYYRILSLVCEHKKTQPQPISISELRTSRGITQDQLADLLGVRQSSLSKMENRSDLKISSLQRVVNVMGGTLLIQAVFKGEKQTKQIVYAIKENAWNPKP